jgi:hypothetical protein
MMELVNEKIAEQGVERADWKWFDDKWVGLPPE